MREYVTHILREEYDIIPAEDGLQALDLIRRDAPDLVLTDVMMPRLDGFELLRAVRADASLRTTPVIFLSARAGEEKRVEGLQAGADDYLVKPFTANELCARVGTHVQMAIARKQAVEREAALRAGAEAARDQAINILEGMTDGFINLDGEWRISYVNAEAERLNGMRRDDMLGKNHWELFPAAVGTAIHREFLRATESGVPVDFENYYAPWKRWFHVKAFPAPAGGLSVFYNDITERKQAEHAALLLGAIVDSSDDAIISKDLNGVITTWNNGAERVFGYTAAEVVGKPITILIPPERLDEEPEILRRLRRGERVDHFDTVRRRKDGTLLQISLTISPVKDTRGKIVGISKIARDITERKHAEAALFASETRFRQLADSMPQMVWTARSDGYVDYYNERWYEFTGLDREKFGDLSWESIIHPDDLKRCRETWYGSVQNGESYYIEYRFWDRSEKRWSWFIGRALPVRDSTGNIVKWFGTCTDIDEQKRTEDELRRANQDLEQFAYSASHDLQEPLRSVKIYSELLTKRYGDRLDGQALEFCDYLRAGATRMEMLVRDLLAYTQVAKLDVPGENVDANEIFKDTLANLSGSIIESEAQVSSGLLPSLRVHGTHLKQLFQNLIGNAIKYRSPDRLAVVHVSAERHNGDWIFSIRDNGIGIDAEYRERIFGLFKRLHTGDEYSGTGIGLAICQRIVDRYHGRIWVESEPGQGSTFFFSVPV
jgi:PAS domain S-box-containing protein